MCFLIHHVKFGSSRLAIVRAHVLLLCTLHEGIGSYPTAFTRVKTTGWLEFREISVLIFCACSSKTYKILSNQKFTFTQQCIIRILEVEPQQLHCQGKRKSIVHFTVVCLVARRLNWSEVKVDLVMIQTLLLFKCKLLCYHANQILVSITTRSPSVSLQIKVLATRYTTVKWPIWDVMLIADNCILHSEGKWR